MSNWTHFVGAIRIRDVEIEKISSIAKLFRTCEFGDSEDNWKRCNVPCGSEGSIQVELINSDGKYVFGEHEWNIVIFGSLRNYSVENEKETINWWFNTIKKIKRKADLFVNAILRIDYDCFDEPSLILTDKKIIRKD